MDNADIAAEFAMVEENFRRRAPHFRPARSTPGIACLECDEDIPAARRRAVPGCCLCVDCQTALEGAMP